MVSTFKIIKKTIAILLIFLVAPIAITLVNWHWEPEALTNYSEYLFWITESAGFPWAILMSVCFFVLFCFCIPVKTKGTVLKLWIILTTIFLVGQAVKSVAKSHFGESRPFVLWIEDEYKIDDAYFYSLPRTERQELISQYVHESPEIPNWLYRHWRNETGYSFPSGHTLFATTWAFLAVAFFVLKRHNVILWLIVGWAVFIEISRLALGMHRSEDLILGSFLAWGISLIGYFWAKKWRIIGQ